MGEAATVHEACRPSCLARLGVEASGEPEGGAAAAAARAAPTVGGEEGGGLVEGSSAALEPLRAYEETKRRTPSWRGTLRDVPSRHAPLRHASLPLF